MPNGARPSKGEFAARLFSGILDSWTARHQQGLAQQREDVVYQQQLADKERLAGERREFEVEREDIAYGRKRELVKEAEPTRLERFMEELEGRESLREELKIKSASDIEHKKELKRLGLWVPKVPTPLKPYKRRDVLSDIKTFLYPQDEIWAKENQSDLVNYIERAFLDRPGEIPEQSDYDDAARSVQSENIALTVTDPQDSPLMHQIAQMDIDPTKKIIPSDLAWSVLHPRGLIGAPLPIKNYSVPELAHMIVATSANPLDFQPAEGNVMYAQLLDALFEILSEIDAYGKEPETPDPYGARKWKESFQQTGKDVWEQFGGVGIPAGGPAGAISRYLAERAARK